jgi:glycosyltransferase involved in cell wall biosynthesis
VTNSLTVVLKVRNEEAMLPGCLRRLDFADEVVAAVDDRTDDHSVEILEAAGVRVAMVPFRGFANLANAGIDLATSDWVFLIDADERVSHALAGEIAVAIEGPFDGLRVASANYFHGQLMQYGGWQERPTKLWRRGAARFEGALHERPVFTDGGARIGQLDAPLPHFSHRSVIDNLTKSANYVEVQARSLYDADAPAVTGWHLFRTLIREIGFRLVLRQGWRDGVVGIYESLYWPFSHMCAQARLWELQQQPPIETAYERLEDTTQ